MVPISRRRFAALAGSLLALEAVSRDGLWADEAKPKFPPAPRLATTPAEFAALQKSADYAAIRAAAVQAGERRLTTPATLPAGPGSWIFYYACPADGADLKPLSLTTHECPQCKQQYTDERTVAAYRCRLHYELEHAALELGWAYAHTSDARFAREVRRLLVFLADQYKTYPARVDRWGRTGWLAPLGGRRYVQSLDEAVGVIRLAKAYDLCRSDAVWTDADRRHVEDDLFYATAQTLLAFNQGVINHQTWYNAGLMAIATVRADEKLVEQVLSMRGGLRDQLQRSISAEGLWCEGTMAYQNYALQAMVELVDAGRRLGLPLADDARFKSLLTSSLEVCYPNGDYPALNDSDPMSFRAFGWSYEWAWQTYRDERFAQAAAWGDAAKLTKLTGTKPVSPFPTRSRVLEDTGLVILRSGSGPRAACVFHDFGPHGGGHGHYDKLGITLFAAGREWLLDPGRIGYSHREYKTWVKHTVAHNTVAVDQASQWPTAGRLLWFQAGDGWSACATECRTAYLGVTLRRQLVLHEGFLAELFEVVADRPRTIDWLAHAVTQPVAPVQPTENQPVESLGKRDGYDHLTQVRKWQPQGASQWDFAAAAQPAAARLRVSLPPMAEGDALFTAQGIGYQPKQAAPCLVWRKKSASARFVAVYDLSGQVTSVAGVDVGAVEAPAAGVLTVRRHGAKVCRIEFTSEGCTLREE